MERVRLRKCKKKLHEYEETQHRICPECRAASSRRGHEKRKLEPGYLEYHKAVQSKHYHKNKDDNDAKLKQRGSRLKYRYWPHLTAWEALAEYERMLASQDYCCKICEVDIEDQEEHFHVDHCHQTLVVRGLLCAVCNKYVVGGIDHRAKAKKVHISLRALVGNIFKYYGYIPDTDNRSLSEMEHDKLTELFVEFEGDVDKISDRLNLTKQTVKKKLKGFGIPK